LSETGRFGNATAIGVQRPNDDATSKRFFGRDFFGQSEFPMTDHSPQWWLGRRSWLIWASLGSGLLALVIFRERSAPLRAESAAQNYAALLARAVWDLDESALKQSLLVILPAEEYRSMTVILDDGSPFASQHAEPASSLAASVQRIRRCDVPVVYRGQQIARLKIEWIDENLVLYAAISVLAALVGALATLFLRSAEQHRALGQLLLEQEVDKRERAEGTLATRELQLQETRRLEALGQLAGGVAHDFNNVLAVIFGYSELLQMGLTADDPRRKYATSIREAAGRAAAITKQLLAFGRRQVLQPQVIDVSVLIHDFEILLRRLLPESIELVIELSPTPAWIKADPSQIDQVLINLVINARDAMPNGGRITLSTVVGLQPGPDADGRTYVTILVSDTGTGMTSEVQRRIFEPFFTTKPEGTGTGLGLATVHGIVCQTGGDIRVASSPGQGSQFSVVIPAADPAAARAQILPSSVTEQEPAPKHELGTVMLVDDEPALLDLMQETLASAGYRVLSAADGEKALKLAEPLAEPIDLVVTDVVMPKLGGPELVRKLRVVRANIKVLYLTGYPADAFGPSGAPSEGDTVLNKPFTQLALRARVAQILARAGS
jgi:signal transduction histidine kinase